MSKEFDVYYVGFSKHNATQYLVAGPFFDFTDALVERDKRGERYIVVTSVVEVTEE